MGLEIVGRLDDLDCSPDHLINQLFPVKSDDKKVTASTPDKQQDAAMADDKKVTNSTPDEQQDADMIEMPEIFISDEIKESDEIARALRAMIAQFQKV